MNEKNYTLNPDKWVEKYSDELFRFSFLRINDYEAAKDLVQDTFLAALRNKESYRGEISERNWLYFLIKNKIIDYYRAKARKIKEESPVILDEEDVFFDEMGHWKKESAPQDWQSTIESTNDFLDLGKFLEFCKKQLNEIQNLIFSLKFIDDKETNEICQELEISSSNYWVLIHRVKLKMRNCLEKHYLKS